MGKFVSVRYKINSNVPAIINGMSLTSTRAINKQMLRAVFIAKQHVPYLTGRLLRSIRVLRYASKTSRLISGRMGSLQPYANKINLQQRENIGSGYMDIARASMVDLKRTLRKEWARTIAQKRLNRRRD